MGKFRVSVAVAMSLTFETALSKTTEILSPAVIPSRVKESALTS